MKISVIVPIYNSVNTIESCIQSILGQTLTDIELILVNDGSTDGSGKICDEYAEKDSRVTVIHQSNKGRTAARWAGVEASVGEWISFVDSDDMLPVNALDNLYKAATDEVDIVLGNGYSLAPESRKTIPMDEFRHMAVRADGTIGVPWGSLYRKSVITNYLFDIPRHIYNGEDYIFWLRLVFSTHKPVNIVYESVYHKGEEHTSNSFHWTAAYCYDLNELRKSAIPAGEYDTYLPDMLQDRLTNMFAVASCCPRREWINSQYYQDLLFDMKKLGIGFSLKQRLFFLMLEIKKNLLWLFLTLLVLGMFVLQLLDALTLSDDLLYYFIWQKDESATPHLIKNFSDLISSQWTHYQITNGRWVVHSIAQAFLCFSSPIIYHTINAFLFALMLYLCSRLIVSREDRIFSMVTMLFLLFVVFADIKTTLLWSMGTFNYLWVTTWTLAFLLYIRKISQSKSLIHYFISPLALLIGCSHEAICLPLLITFLIYFFVNIRKVKLYPCSLYIFWYIIGALICILSPGILKRADSDITLQNRIISGAINIIFNLKVTWLLLVSLLITYYYSKEKSLYNVVKYSYFYICLLLSLGIVAVCGTNLERVVYYADFIAMILLVSIWSEWISEKWKKWLIIAFSFVTLIYYIPALLVRLENYSNSQYMQHQMHEKNKEVIAIRYPVKGKEPIKDFFRNRFVNNSAAFGFYCCYMGFNAHDVNMRCAATISGKKQLIFLPEDVINRIEKDSTAYRSYELDSHEALYIWQLPDDKQVHKVIFELKPEDISKLNIFQRLVAYKEDTYEYDDNFHYSVVHVDGRPYLVFTRPTTNIYRRISRISYL